jgi:glycosyltransferase involved in cell wall biosynthesis
MTPLGPNGQNGGAGLVATSIVRHVSALAPDLRLTLLTANDSHAEQAALDRDNVQRRCVITRSNPPTRVRRLIERLVPPGARVRAKRVYGALRTSRRVGRLSQDLQPDLLFSPFTLPYFWRRGVPSISTVYDLQHVRYPEFFTAEQRLNRIRHIEEAVARSERVVCISEYVRQTLLASVEVCAERVVTIPLGLLHEVPASGAPILHRLGVEGGNFLVYPANFWPHKNHRRLFEALRIYRQKHASSRLRLVCTGAPNQLMRELAAGVSNEHVVFAGYVSEADLATLYEASCALIFPSLYEGFGLPVLEAMARGRPVLCSNVTSLPEVAGDAAVYFDPTDSEGIVTAIEALSDRPTMAALAARGRQRAPLMGTGRTMAVCYLDLFRDVLTRRDGS